MKRKYAIRINNVRELKPGDRVAVIDYYGGSYIGYVESLGDLNDDSYCVYLDVRWRKRRKAVDKWFRDDTMHASNAFKLAFNSTTMYKTNMGLKQAVARLLPGSNTDPLEIPF